MDTARLFLPYLEPAEFDEIARGFARSTEDRSWWREVPLGTERAVAACAQVEASQYNEWGRLLSAESGGFCLGQSDSEALPAIFYSGQPLNPSAGDTWEGWYWVLCGLPWNPRLADFSGVGSLAARAVSVQPARHWTRAAFASVEGAAFIEAVEKAFAVGFAVQDWRWLHRRTSLAELSFVMMEKPGACDIQLLQFLAKRLDTHAAALEFDPASTPLEWWLDSTGVLDSGEAPLASDVAELCRSLCITMGEAAGQLRWPRREPCRSLLQTCGREVAQ